MAASGQEFRFFEASDLEFKRPLGAGGFGSVYLAFDKKMGYEVAIKELTDVNVKKEVLMKEASRMLKVITCPNLVHLMGITENPTNKSLGIVMEFLEYGDLMTFNRKYMMQADCMARKVKMIHDIALGINFLHNQDPPVIHRDLKLENVFLGQGFIAKIGDLGLALSTNSIKNMKKVEGGTFSHCPPEGFSSSAGKPDEFSDTFTFAITTFELTTGKDPWPEHAAKKPGLISFWLEKGDRPNLEHIPDNVPAEIVELIKKCWVQKPTDRLRFQAILKIIASALPTKSVLFKADAALMASIEQAGEEETDANADSSMDSAWGSLEVMSISNKGQSKTTAVAASRDSGNGSQQHITSGTWELLQEFGEQGDGEGQFKEALDVAACHNGNIVVTDFRSSHSVKAYLFSSTGSYKFTFQSHPSNPDGKLKYPSRVAITPDGEIVLTDESNRVKIYTSTCQYSRSICTTTPECDHTTKYNTCGVAVSPSGVIYVGDIHRRVITVHRGQQPPSKLQVSIEPIYLACDRLNRLWVSDWQVRKVVVMESNGKEVRCIDRFRVDGKVGRPSGIACHGNDVFIVVKAVDETDDTVLLNTGHLHQYDTNGDYQRCIIKNMYFPRGITISNQKIYVANSKSVLVYGQV